MTHYVRSGIAVLVGLATALTAQPAIKSADISELLGTEKAYAQNQNYGPCIVNGQRSRQKYK